MHDGFLSGLGNFAQKGPNVLRKSTIRIYPLRIKVEEIKLFGNQNGELREFDVGASMTPVCHIESERLVLLLVGFLRNTKRAKSREVWGVECS